MEDSSEIEKLRKIIDEVDISLLNLMNKRADVAKQIGLVKKNQPDLQAKFRVVKLSDSVSDNEIKNRVARQFLSLAYIPNKVQ